MELTQYDVVEYLSFLRPLLGTQIGSGRWQPRQHVDGTCPVLDEDDTWPLLLPAPLLKLTAQAETVL